MQSAKRAASAFCWTALLSLAVVGDVAAESIRGRVVGVADGDTLTVLSSAKVETRIRLAEIDAPESGQPFGDRAKRLLSDLCFGVEARVDVTTVDRYGRSVGFVHCRDSDANAELVRNGLAWVYVRYARPASPYFDLEKAARSERKGVWSESGPVPPWDWRRGVRGPDEGSGLDATSGQHEVRGNQRSGVYHLPECPSFHQVSEKNRVAFSSESEAKVQGFRKAGNCP